MYIYLSSLCNVDMGFSRTVGSAKVHWFIAGYRPFETIPPNLSFIGSILSHGSCVQHNTHS